MLQLRAHKQLLCAWSAVSFLQEFVVCRSPSLGTIMKSWGSEVLGYHWPSVKCLGMHIVDYLDGLGNGHFACDVPQYKAVLSLPSADSLAASDSLMVQVRDIIATEYFGDVLFKGVFNLAIIKKTLRMIKAEVGQNFDIMDGVEALRAVLSDLSRPGLVYQKQDRVHARRVATAIRQVGRERVRSFIQGSCGKPLLVAYMTDTTSHRAARRQALKKLSDEKETNQEKRSLVLKMGVLKCDL